MANEFVARNGVIAQDNSIITGSLTVTNGITGSLLGTASFANTATSASFASIATSASFASTATSASFATNANTATSATTATTAGALTSMNISQFTNNSGYITAASVGNGTLTLGVSGVGLAGSTTFTANQAGGSTFTVTSNATSANTINTIVSRDGSGNFTAGTITATTLIETSALRYKENITDLKSADILYKLRPVSFDWKSNNKSDIGFIAEEVNELIPILAELNEDGEVEGVKYSKITTLLTKIVQNHQDEIIALKTNINILTEKINNLKNK